MNSLSTRFFSATYTLYNCTIELREAVTLSRIFFRIGVLRRFSVKRSSEAAMGVGKRAASRLLAGDI